MRAVSVRAWPSRAPSGSGEVERLLEAHGVDLRLAARHKRFAFDLIEPLLVIKHRDVGMTAARPRDAELTAVNRADAVGYIKLDLAAQRHGLDRMVNQGAFVRCDLGQLGDRH